MWNLTDCKLIVVSSIIATLLILGALAASHVLPWFTSIEKVSQTSQFIVSIIFTYACIFVAMVKLDDLWDWEEEIVDELTIHQEPVFFRISVTLGIFILALFCSMAQFLWPVRLGIITGGLIIWIYFSDILLEMFTNWEECWDNITSDMFHALRMTGMGVIVILISIVFSLSSYGNLVVLPIDPTLEQKPKTMKEKIYDFMDSLKQKLPWSETKNQNENLENLLENVESKQLAKWLEELTEAEIDQDYRNFVDNLPRERKKLLEKWHQLPKIEDEKIKTYWKSTLRHLQEKRKNH